MSVKIKDEPIENSLEIDICVKEENITDHEASVNFEDFQLMQQNLKPDPDDENQKIIKYSKKEINEERNSVPYLQKKKFSHMKINEKIEIKYLGRLTPNLNISQSSRCRTRNYTRKFNSDIYKKYNWITGCSEKNAIFCFPCLLFGGDKPWTKKGISDLQHMLEKSRKHEKSARHLKNIFYFGMLGTDIKMILSENYRQAIIDHNNNVKRNRQILSRIIECILFCGKFNLPLHGDDETLDSNNHEVFRALLAYTQRLDDDFKRHFSTSTAFKGSLKTIQNELLDCILDTCKNKIKAEIKKANYLAVMTDDTTDVSELNQQVIVFRYELEGTVYERFWGFFNSNSENAEDLADCILEQLGKVLDEESDKNKLIAQTYDGAAVMSGERGGVQTILKNSYKNAHFIHCYAHQFNLIMEKAASQNLQARIFFSSLAAIPSFFTEWPARLAVLKEVSKRILGNSNTQWNFNSRVVNTVFENKEILIKCFEFLQKNTNQSTVQDATGLIRMLNDENFNFWLSFFNEIMPHIDILSNQLLHKNANSVDILNAVENFCSIILKKRDNIEHDLNQYQHHEYEPLKKKTRLSGLNSNIAAKEVCDLIILQAEEQFTFTKHLSAANLFFPCINTTNDFELSQNELQDIVDAYPVCDKDRLTTELRILYEQPEFKNLQGISKIYEIMHTTGIHQSFVEVIKLLRIILTTPMITAEPERCFSSLKRIKTYLRNTINQDRLTALAMLNIENNIVSSIEDFNEKVIERFVNQKEQRTDFIFK